MQYIKLKKQAEEVDLFSDDEVEEGTQPISHEDYERLIQYLEKKNPPAITECSGFQFFFRPQIQKFPYRKAVCLFDKLLVFIIFQCFRRSFSVSLLLSVPAYSF